MASLLKDIKAERPKITEKDNVRLLYVTKWFLEFFLCERARQPEGSKWKFGLIAEVTDRGWIVWVLRRMREAQEKVRASTGLAYRYLGCMLTAHICAAEAVDGAPSGRGVPHAVRPRSRHDGVPAPTRAQAQSI